MMNRTILAAGLLMVCSVFSYGQSDRKIIEDAWVYLDNWETYSKSGTLDLVKSWNTQTVCLVSFERGIYTVDDKQAKRKEKGSWQLKKDGARTLIIIELDDGHTMKFEVLMINNNNLKLKRVT